MPMSFDPDLFGTHGQSSGAIFRWPFTPGAVGDEIIWFCLVWAGPGDVAFGEGNIWDASLTVIGSFTQIAVSPRENNYRLFTLQATIPAGMEGAQFIFDPGGISRPWAYVMGSWPTGTKTLLADKTLADFEDTLTANSTGAVAGAAWGFEGSGITVTPPDADLYTDYKELTEESSIIVGRITAWAYDGGGTFDLGSVDTFMRHAHALGAAGRWTLGRVGWS